MEGSINELAKYRYEKAVHSHKIAVMLYENGEYGYAQNRAYYALFDAMRSVTALDGFDSSKHSGIIAHFNKNYVKTGIFPQNTSRIIKKASMLR